MNTPKRLRQEHQQEVVSEQRQETRAVEYGSVEELLRDDRSRSVPSPEVAARLGVSLAAEPPRPWWKRLLPKW
jgi:hypothetical protein